MEVSFIENIKTSISNWDSIKAWIISSIKNEGLVIGDITFVFMSDDSLLAYNQKHLNHNYYTDVITFDDSEMDTVNGDILISVDRIMDNHKTLKTSYKEEFLRVCIHGVLHLCGYTDKEESAIIMMRLKESFYLDKVSFNV